MNSWNVRMAVGVLVVVLFAYLEIKSDTGPSTNNEQTTVATTAQQSPEELKKQEAERLQKEQEERERKKREAAEKNAQEERRRQEEIARKEQEKAQKELNEINSHSYTEISVSKLMNDLKINAARANKNYNGKYYKIIGGIVKGIESEGYYIILDAPPTPDIDINLHNIQCYPKTDLAKEQIFRLNMNQRVTVYGKITDVGEIMGYELELLKIE